LSITDTVADDFAIMVAEPHDQQTQANGTVIYEINLDYGDNFTSDVNLTTDIETIFDANTFTSVTFDPSAIVNQSTINPIILTLVIGSTPTPLNTLETFTITGTSGTLVHNALAADGTPPALTIVDGSVNNIIIIFTVPVQDTPSMTLPSLFTFNLYPEGAATKNDFAVSLSDLAPTSYDLINKIVTFNLIVSKDLLVDGATYTVYTRSTRNFWTKANNPADGLTVDFSQTALNVGFPELIAGDVMPPVRDNQINSLDASNILYNWFKIPPDVNLVCDFNNDDFINSVDMSYILYNWFKSGDPFFD